MPEEKRSLKVFLCHASDDKPVVRQLYENLCLDGIDAWLDSEKLVPGQKWQLEIPKAVRGSDVVIVCLSKSSVNKDGYVKTEIEFALDIAEEQPEGTIFVIPARLEDCQVPERLSKYQWVNLFEVAGYNRLIDALGIRASQIDAKPPGRKGISSLLHPVERVAFDDFAKEAGARKLSDAEEKKSVANHAGPRQKSRIRFFVEVVGLVASLLGIITFLTGIENIGKYFKPETPVPKVEVLTPGSTPIQTSTLRTTTTSVPIQTGAPTLTPTAHILVYEPADGKAILQESFDNNDNQWRSYYEGRVASVENGHIRVVSYEKGYVNVAMCDGCGDYSDNFYYQADVKLSQFRNLKFRH